MKQIEEDKAFREVIRDLKLDSPGENFTMSVINRIHKEVPASIQTRKEPSLGKEFWIVILLFMVLSLTIFLLTQPAQESGRLMDRFLNPAGAETANALFRRVTYSFLKIPAGISGILAASSLLIFIERIFSPRGAKA